MTRTIDITGHRYGMLTAIKYYDHVISGKHKVSRWLCICDCGKEHIVRKACFMRGKVKSCGCRGSKSVAIGDRYGKWLVLSPVTKNSRKGFLCRCDCGAESWIVSYDLASGKSTKCISCGYLRHESTKMGDSARRGLYNKYKKGAQRRKVSFELTFDEFSELISQDCFYSGHPPQNIARPQQGRNTKVNAPASPIFYNGLDRMDNSRGYTIDNLVPCCSPCNRAKRAMPYNEWVEWIKQFNPNTEKLTRR